MSLSAFLDCLCGRWWQAFEGVESPIQALRYFPPQSSLFTWPDNKALIVSLLTPWHRPRYLKCHLPHTFYYCQPWISVANHLLATSLWFSVLAVIHERRCEFSICWAIWAYKFVCLPGVTLEKDGETWLPACNSAWFWGAYYLARPYCLGHSFVAWHLYCHSFLKCLGVGEVLLVHGHQLLEIKDNSSAVLDFEWE